MASDDPNRLRDEYDAATRNADHHEAKARDLERRHAEHSRDGSQDAESLLDRSRTAASMAESYRMQAQELAERYGRAQHEPGDEATPASPYSARRAWVLPGTVSQDVIQQLDEAQQESLISQSMKYAARSLVERDGAAYNAVKDALTPQTSDPTPAAGAQYADQARELAGRYGREPDRHSAKAPARDKDHEPQIE